MTEAASPLAALSAAVHPIIARVFGILPDRVVGGAALVTDLGASSLDIVELVMAIEDAFRIEISDHNAATVVTVDDLEKLIARLQATGRVSIAA